MAATTVQTDVDVLVYVLAPPPPEAVLVTVGAVAYRLYVAEYELESIAIVRAVNAVHWAYNVKLAVRPCAYEKLIADPPDDATNQPSNVYPARVGVPGEDEIDPPVVVDPSEIDEPPCESYVTVKLFAVHWAYSVTSAEIANVDAAARDVPPHAAPAAGCVVHQPPNE